MRNKGCNLVIRRLAGSRHCRPVSHKKNFPKRIRTENFQLHSAGRTYGHMCKSAHEWVCEQYRKKVRPGSHTAGVAGRLWSEVAVASLKHPVSKKDDPRQAKRIFNPHSARKITTCVGGGAPSSHPSLGCGVFFLSFFLSLGTKEVYPLPPRTTLGTDHAPRCDWRGRAHCHWH